MITLDRFIIRLMLGLAVAFFVLTLLYFDRSFAVLPFLFILVFLAADRIFASSSLNQSRGQRVVSAVILVLLVFVIVSCFIAVAAVWKLGPFSRLN